MLALFTGMVLAQDIPVYADTTELKASEERGIVILEQFGGYGTYDRTGGGLFHFADSSISEGTHAFDHPYTGKQWQRVQYTGGEEQDFDAITAVDLTLTDDLIVGDDADIGGNITLENDEVILNSTDADVEFRFNDDAAVLGQFIINSVNDSANLADDDNLELVFRFYDDSLGVTDWATVIVTATDVSDESEDSQIEFKTFSGGSEVTPLTLTGANTTIAETLTQTGKASFTAAPEFTVGFTSTTQVIQCTDAVVADTNVITAGVTNVSVSATNQNSDDFIVLPAIGDVPIGHTITIVANSTTDFELRTVASSDTKINNVDADGSQEYLVTDANTVFIHKVSDSYGWAANDFDHVGAIVSAHVPN